MQQIVNAVRAVVFMARNLLANPVESKGCW